VTRGVTATDGCCPSPLFVHNFCMRHQVTMPYLPSGAFHLTRVPVGRRREGEAEVLGPQQLQAHEPQHRGCPLARTRPGTGGGGGGGGGGGERHSQGQPDPTQRLEFSCVSSSVTTSGTHGGPGLPTDASRRRAASSSEATSSSLPGTWVGTTQKALRDIGSMTD
jgi:hypothetical protein